MVGIDSNRQGIGFVPVGSKRVAIDHHHLVNRGDTRKGNSIAGGSITNNTYSCIGSANIIVAPLIRGTARSSSIIQYVYSDRPVPSRDYWKLWQPRARPVAGISSGGGVQFKNRSTCEIVMRYIRKKLRESRFVRVVDRIFRSSIANSDMARRYGATGLCSQGFGACPHKGDNSNDKKACAPYRDSVHGFSSPWVDGYITHTVLMILVIKHYSSNPRVRYCQC
jgi:hypothetical protein